MTNPDARLTLLTFPQSWDGSKLELRVLALPKGNPRLAPLPGAPPFAQATLALDVVIVAGLDSLPSPGVESARIGLGMRPAAPGRAGLYAELETCFAIKPTPPGQVIRPPGTQIMKYLMPSYREAFAFRGPRTEYAVIDDRYRCVLTETNVAARPPRPPVSHEVTWGQVLAFGLKNPLLAEKLGLLHADLSVPAGDLFETGGWLYATLGAHSAYAAQAAADPSVLAVYAARIPALSGPRALFSAVQFPVLATPPGTFDDLFVEAASYDDGFAKIVHGAQPRTMGIADLDPSEPLPVKDIGIRLGWDDEQVAIWLNRAISPATVEDTVLGVGGYRVDVRLAGTETWSSMVRVRSDVRVGSIDVGRFEGELGVRTTPAQLLGAKTGDYWLPSYFTSWAGRSVVTGDRTALEVSGRTPRMSSSEPVGDQAVALRYGRDYEFRVRLMDLSGGGPPADRLPRNPAPAPIRRVPFRRHVPPKQVKVTAEPARLLVERPLIGYPDLVFTGFDQPVAALLADTAQAVQEQRETGVHDPDVKAVQIAVEVRLPDGDDRGVDGEPYLRLYTALRRFESAAPLAAPLPIDLTYVDVKDVAALRPADPSQPTPGTGPLAIPTARDVRVRIRAVGDPDPELAYWGSDQARIAQLDAGVHLRQEATDERALWSPDAPGRQIQAILLPPEPAPTSHVSAELAMEGRQNQAPDDVASRLAQQLDLDVSGLTFAGRPGHRTIFGCSSRLAHTLTSARSGITFASKLELTRQWIIAIRVGLDRDWTWSGVTSRGFEIVDGSGEVVGTLDLPRSAGAQARPEPDRTRTELVFFDALDGTPPAGRHPEELTTSYSVRPVFREPSTTADPPLTWELRLPITTPPRQTPRLVSAGLAQSSYEPAPDYSSTQPRARRLWLEFALPPADPGDQYFARVLGYAPDPLLIPLNEDIATPAEPPLPIDPEPMRVITPGQSADNNGLAAMQPLIPAQERDPDAPIHHYVLPLPPGMDETSQQLFGFFVYELRLGHGASRWSTAQARFGPPLRVTGVQHPAPPLACSVSRLPETILVSAPVATPVHNGRLLRPARPRTQIWALIYAQVTQFDGERQRNVLLARAPARTGLINTNQRYADQGEEHAIARFRVENITSILASLGLNTGSPLSVMTVELYQDTPDRQDPLGDDLGHVRILRTSPLTAVPQMCLP
ncbi:hypothetical protein [Nonomuraea ceibae]|uniref:hypothetical protein n=1 Tax=Nonomuraea ceibae TaxID=1935170 RepID=UPI001C5DB14B|nr:hypothetical protein [Nonomuraea ceibae]